MADNIFPEIAETIFDALVTGGGLATVVTIKRISESTYDESTANYTNTTTETVINGFVSGFKIERTEELSDFKYDKKLLYLNKDYPNPLEDDIFTIQDEDYNVFSIEKDPANATITIYLTKISFT